MSRYHKAAIDGYLDLLKEATRKDLNAPDEDGMTPTLWAAFHGHVEALQLICSRGGDPDRSDIWGNTPLHHAANNGHMAILSFLVNFGANLFSLDNDFHSAMDVAASRDRMDCVRFLDTAASQQTARNAKKVAKLKEQAAKEAERRVKMCEKVKKRHQSKMDRLHRGSTLEPGPSGHPGTGTVNGVSEQFDKLLASDATGSLSARVKGTLQRKFGKKEKGVAEGQGDRNVIFVKQDNGTLSRPGFVDVFSEQDEMEDGEEDGSRGINEDDEGEEEEEEESGPAKESIFNRPGLGNMVFRKNFSLEMGVEPEEFAGADGDDLGFRIRSEVFQPEETGGDAEPDLPWNDEDIGLDEEDEEMSPLAGFLAALGLLDYAPVLAREQLDMEALLLCSDTDLKSLRIQLGPRKKILEAAARRKSALQNPGAMADCSL
ncbi:ankyrin repeat and SAM domain-containing protein 4B [Anguilla anguilla]|uniref:ankyrin repeat and SAM domain-containing protein 4B n=1 Tax=Anguilla anguilla TaxID=7936 RepID=UPI0015ADD466|nr:ankyrin repeat and SAM domain-containing protein 4B [Anguilla anguilla]